MSMKIEIDLKDYQIIRKGLLLLPAGEVLEIIAKLDNQILEEEKKKKNITMARPSPTYEENEELR